ncbi:MAG: TRAP transporter substrate-binding protein DctP [Treponema sp.]|nr:TRAP transporter substrate-binding protein DctP [Treponema sp.]
MKKSRFFVNILVLAFLCVFARPAGLFAQRGTSSSGIEIKLASPLPENSAWGEALKKLATDWGRATNNQVRVRILHNAMEGGEEKMISSLNSNNIQAALFSSFGLSAICPPVMTISVPFNIKNDAELDAVYREIEPVLDNIAGKSNHHVLAWSRAGWVNIFSKDQIYTPDDLKRIKIASNAEAEHMNNVFRSMGFQIVETDWTDVGPKVNSGVVSAVYQISPVVAAYRLDDTMKNMMSTPIAPVIGGIVINNVTWSKISPAHQQELMRITRRIAAEFDANMPKTAGNAVTAMTRRGLKVNQLNRAQEELWENEIKRVIPSLIGVTFDNDLYQRINNILSRYRGSR